MNPRFNIIMAMYLYISALKCNLYMHFIGCSVFIRQLASRQTSRISIGSVGRRAGRVQTLARRPEKESVFKMTYDGVKNIVVSWDLNARLIWSGIYLDKLLNFVTESNVFEIIQQRHRYKTGTF